MLLINHDTQIQKGIIIISPIMEEQGSKYDVLIIESDDGITMMISTYLESKGYSCKGVECGLEGLEELKTIKPKVILLDIMRLPDSDGYDICKKIKFDEKYKNISVFYLTAVPGIEVKKHMKETGADGYILKPFQFSDFDVVLDILREKQ